MEGGLAALIVCAVANARLDVGFEVATAQERVRGVAQDVGGRGLGFLHRRSDRRSPGPVGEPAGEAADDGAADYGPVPRRVIDREAVLM